jgi:V8-like Glu-specific endopeptidase
MKSVSQLSFAFLIALASTGSAFAVPVGLPNEQIVPFEGADVDFEGTVSIGSRMTGGCSAAIVRYETSLPTDPAMVLTNGHCLEGGMMGHGQFIINEGSKRSFTVLDPKNPDREAGLGKIRAKMVIYGTMTRTDIALYGLEETFEEIEAKMGIRPLVLSSRPAEAGVRIEIPSGYWRTGYACEIETVVPTLKEGEWIWKDSLRYSEPGCDTKGGTSGSPIVAAGTRTVIAINNTGNESGEECTMNNPCEVDRDGKIFYEKGLSYGQQIHWIYSCLDQDLNFDLLLESCVLPGGTKDKTDSKRVY